MEEHRRRSLRSDEDDQLVSVKHYLNGSISDCWRTLMRFIGPGSMIAVGYMDPGNWSADLGGGAKFQYTLLSIVLLSGLSGMFFQYLAIKLGVVSGADLAQASRRHCPRWLNWLLYLMAEIAIMATDLAEVIGSAIALNLLFGLPLIWGVLLTALDVLVVLQWWGKQYVRVYEFAVILLVVIVGVCFAWQLALVRPPILEILHGFLPSPTLFEPGCLLYVTAIFGATVMPHNLYLHSSLAKFRRVTLVDISRPAVENGTGPGLNLNSDITSKDSLGLDDKQQQMEGSFDLENEPLIPAEETFDPKSILLTLRYATVDCILALIFALLINATILIVGAAALNGHPDEIKGLSDAYYSLQETVGQLAATLFAVALLTSGQSSTVTGTMAGQIVMTGFLELRIKPWIRRIFTRVLAIMPALVTVMIYGDRRLNDLLVISQVILNIQLPFAVIPLIYFTSNQQYLTPGSAGEYTASKFVNNRITTILSSVLAALVISLNLYLVYDSMAQN